ncbi:MAG TPA: aminopeptidase [Clostridia bacterium]|nr:aminopeptidase [Clostridia bacterium]
MANFDKKLSEYADLVIRAGLNIGQGQTLWLNCATDCAMFATMLAQAAYSAGAGDVVVDWSNAQLSRLRYLNALEEVFHRPPDYTIEKYRNMASIGAASLALLSTDLEAAAGINPVRVQNEQKALGEHPVVNDYVRRRAIGEWQWSVAGCVTPQWAKKVFIGRTEEQAVKMLWDAVFNSVLVTGDGLSDQKWQIKTQKGLERIARLNNYGFKSLSYKNSIGTELNVELPNGHYWAGCSMHTKNGTKFVPNLPTDEVFTTPRREGINGTIIASRPMNTPAGLVEGLGLVLRAGKIVESTARAGQNILAALLDTDEGARYLGEIALVEHDSPVSMQNMLFYNTLFDENASCHFALGRGYPLIRGAETLSKNEQSKLGLNCSAIHCDFMVGTPDLEITGVTKEGRFITVFEEGKFVI